MRWVLQQNVEKIYFHENQLALKDMILPLSVSVPNLISYFPKKANLFALKVFSLLSFSSFPKWVFYEIKIFEKNT